MDQQEPRRILVVDDEAYVCELVARWLRSEGHQCGTAGSAEEALEILASEEFHLMISDILMPGMSGIELLSAVRHRYPSMAVLMITAVDDRQTGVTALELGAYGYVIKPFERNEVLINVANALHRRDLTQLSDQYERNLSRHARRYLEELKGRDKVVLRMISVTGARHGETYEHLMRVGRISAEIAGLLRPNRTLSDLDEIEVAAAMHDIGKLAVPDRILLKSGPLTMDERAEVEQHCEHGALLCESADSTIYTLAREIALGHHENWNGSGYPKGLQGDAIPEMARVAAVADTFDALTHWRPYRPAYSEKDALEIITGDKGVRFDPRVVDAFVRGLPRIGRILDEFKDAQSNLLT